MSNYAYVRSRAKEHSSLFSEMGQYPSTLWMAVRGDMAEHDAEWMCCFHLCICIVFSAIESTESSNCFRTRSKAFPMSSCHFNTPDWAAARQREGVFLITFQCREQAAVLIGCSAQRTRESYASTIVNAPKWPVSCVLQFLWGLINNQPGDLSL